MRQSKQRTAIWNYIKERKDHPTAEMVYRAVRKAQPNISLGTVYRNLLLLRETGQLSTVDIGDGVTHFDPNTSEHSHFVCSACGRLLDMELAEHARLREMVPASFAGVVTDCHATFYGVCENCLANQPTSA